MRASDLLRLLLPCVIVLEVAASPRPTATLSARDSTSTACGDIVNNNQTFIFNASLAFECLTSVPFNPAVATRFLQYYNDTLQFQSTLTYLKDPPASYQQPAVDLLEGLNQLQTAVNEGMFANQYEFEAALQTLIYSAHEGHLDLLAGVLSAFSFASPYDIVSLSLDGQETPKLYLAEDLFDSNYFTEFQPSAISTINGKDATTYLSEFASLNSFGTIESHTDWNQLMLSAAQDIQGFFNSFSGGATFYPGDTITFGLENGTNITDFFLAIYDSAGPTGPLETGGDFYNFFVLGFYPASYDPNADDSTDDSADDSTDDSTDDLSDDSGNSTVVGWDNEAYPTPNVTQEDLGTFGDGYVSGYFLNSSVAVLSIPSFDVYDDTVITFQTSITDFINNVTAAGIKKVVIDVQQNYGGQTLLAIDTFKQFFPNIDPFAGSRMRAHASANVLGETMTSYWDDLSENDETKFDLASDEWIITDRINAENGQNFTNWAEFFGPNSYDGDTFTNIERFNLSSPIFDMSATGLDVDDIPFAVYGYDANPAPANAAPPFAAEDIIILSDGICHSACALLMELFRHEAGVRVVAVGGTPSQGPMQAPAGTRGALDYYVDTLDANIDFVQHILQNESSPEATFLPNRTTQNDLFFYYLDINLRDSVRKGETIPLQFAYEAADCRIYYTPQTVYNYTNLWQYAADSIWTNPSLCVKGSTGYSTTGQNTTEFVSPPSGTPGITTNLTNYLSTLTHSPISYAILQQLDEGLPAVTSNSKARNAPSSSTSIVPCSAAGTCKGGQVCVNVPTCVGGARQKQCVNTCPSLGSKVCGSTRCTAASPLTSVKVTVGSQKAVTKFCPPASSALTCGAKTTTPEVNTNACPDCSK